MNALVYSFPQLGSVPYGMDGMADMNIIEFFIGICPACFVLDVIYDKQDILRDPIGLNRRQIHAVKFAVGVIISHCMSCQSG